MKKLELKRKEDLKSRLELYELFKHINKLPYELRNLILVLLTSDQVFTLIQELVGDNEFDKLTKFSGDLNFWYLHLLSNGFRLAERVQFDKLVSLLHSKGQTLSRFFKILIWPTNGKELDQRDQIITQLINLWDKSVEFEKISSFVLEFDMIMQQTEILEQGQVQVVLIYLCGRDNILEQHKRIKVKDFVKLITNDIKSLHDFKPYFHWIKQKHWEKYRSLLVSQLIVDQTLTRKLIHQNVDFYLNKLIRGNIVRISWGSIYFFDGNELILTTEGTKNGIYLPAEAIPFLHENDLKNVKDLRKFYFDSAPIGAEFSGVVSPSNPDKLLKKW